MLAHKLALLAMPVLLNGTGVYKGKIECHEWGSPRGRKQIKNESFRSQANYKAMLDEDRDGFMIRLAESKSDVIVSLHAPLPSFCPGQSIIQWWASWFKTAVEPPKKYKKKLRPAWFSGEVLSYSGYKSIKYAGLEQSIQHCYVCY